MKFDFTEKYICIRSTEVEADSFEEAQHHFDHHYQHASPPMTGDMEAVNYLGVTWIEAQDSAGGWQPIGGSEYRRQ